MFGLLSTPVSNFHMIEMYLAGKRPLKKLNKWVWTKK